jgi:hypothetical protein
MRAVVRRIAESAGIDPGVALRTFDALTRPIERSVWPEVAWRFSRLTSDGCPVEFVFSTADSALRYTTEAAGPETPEHERIDAACALLERLHDGTPVCPPELIAEWREMQAHKPLRWGCWLGVRHDATGERFKLYIEVPRGTGPAVMIGYEPASGRLEHYFRKKPMAIGDLTSLCPSAPQVLEQAFGMPIETALRFFSPGYSMAWGQVAFFLRSGWIGGSQAVRNKLLARESDGALHCYRAMLGKQTARELPDHGVVTVALDGHLRAGISGAALASLA